MAKEIGRTRNIRQGHHGGTEGNAGDRVEVGEMAKEEVNRAENQDPYCGADRLAVFAQQLMHFLQRLPSRDHVHDTRPDLDHQLLRYHNVKPEFLPKRVLSQLVIPVEPSPRNHLVHFDHLP